MKFYVVCDFIPPQHQQFRNFSVLLYDDSHYFMYLLFKLYSYKRVVYIFKPVCLSMLQTVKAANFLYKSALLMSNFLFVFRRYTFLFRISMVQIFIYLYTDNYLYIFHTTYCTFFGKKKNDYCKKVQFLLFKMQVIPHFNNQFKFLL